MKTYAEAFRAAREKKGLSQQQLAKMAGIDRHTINYLECGRHPNPSLQTVECIADALGMTIDEIIKQ